jgi:hypothetical protein
MIGGVDEQIIFEFTIEFFECVVHRLFLPLASILMQPGGH